MENLKLQYLLCIANRRSTWRKNLSQRLISVPHIPHLSNACPLLCSTYCLILICSFFCQRPSRDEKSSNLKEILDDNCSEVFTLLHEANCSSMSSVNKNFIPTSTVLRNSCPLREFVPSLKEVVNHDKYEFYPMSFLNFKKFMRLINLMSYRQLIKIQVSLQTWRILALHMRNQLKFREKMIWTVLHVQMRCKPLIIILNMLLCMS